MPARDLGRGRAGGLDSALAGARIAARDARSAMHAASATAVLCCTV
jgi:hypothetical protein